MVTGLLAHAHGGNSRSAARIAKAILGINPPSEAMRLSRILGVHRLMMVVKHGQPVSVVTAVKEPKRLEARDAIKYSYSSGIGNSRIHQTAWYRLRVADRFY